MGPPRPVPLPKRQPRGKLRTDSTYDWREIGEQVTVLEVSISARRRWLEKPEHLKDGKQYRPGALSRVADALNALNPADYGLGTEDDPNQNYEMYEVRVGDTLSGIAKAKFGDPR